METLTLLRQQSHDNEAYLYIVFKGYHNEIYFHRTFWGNKEIKYLFHMFERKHISAVVPVYNF